MDRRAWTFLAAVVSFLTWVAIDPPRPLATLGFWRLPLASALVVVLLVFVLRTTIASHLRRSTDLAPVAGRELPNAVRRLVVEFETEDFVVAGPLLEAATVPPTLTVPLVNERESSFASVICLGPPGGRVAFDCFSFLAAGGWLVSGAEPGADLVPVPDDCFCQVLPGASVATVCAAHREGRDWLARHDRCCRPAAPAAFESELRAAGELQLRHFLAAPLRRSLVALWRAVTRRTPHLGDLASQPLARKRVQGSVTAWRAS